MSFGKKILEKYGYKDGEGLGKQKNGIIEPIKANFKFDNSGLGDKGPVKEDHWWERVFNEASTNINVKKSEKGEIGIDLNDKEGVEITNKSYSLKKLKNSNTKLQYGNFLKSATLLANKGLEKEIEGHVTTDEIEIKPFQVLSDEDLLKACEFRTAHKGARHGLNLSGKLQRIAEQEKILLEKMKTNRSEVFKLPTEEKKKTKKRKLADLNSSKDESSDENELPINLEDNTKKPSKYEKKKNKKQIKCLADQIESFGLDKSLSTESIPKNKADPIVHVDTPIRKKKKEKIRNKEAEELNKIVEEIEQVDEPKFKRNKRKNKAQKRIINGDDEVMPDVETKKPESCDNPVKIKRAKLEDESASNSSDEDIDKLNEIHHINMSNKVASVEPKAKNFENSIKKKKKKKGKSKASLITDDSWKIQSQKKMEKYEQKKLKYKLKQEKLMKQEAKLSKKSKKRLRKEEKKKFAALTDTVITEINSVGL